VKLESVTLLQVECVLKVSAAELRDVKTEEILGWPPRSCLSGN
jgi:hypothetical protein